MFKNVGKKIKVLSIIFFCIQVTVAIIAGIIYACDTWYFHIGLVRFLIIAVGGSFWAWFSSLMLFGFGKLVENSDKLVGQEEKNYKKSDLSCSNCGSDISSANSFCTSCGTAVECKQ